MSNFKKICTMFYIGSTFWVKCMLFGSLHDAQMKDPSMKWHTVLFAAFSSPHFVNSWQCCDFWHQWLLHQFLSLKCLHCILSNQHKEKSLIYTKSPGISTSSIPEACPEMGTLIYGYVEIANSSQPSAITPAQKHNRRTEPVWKGWCSCP